MRERLDRIIERYKMVLEGTVDSANCLITPLADEATIAIGYADMANPTHRQKVDIIFELAYLLRLKVTLLVKS